jgi:ribonuclease P protein component
VLPKRHRLLLNKEFERTKKVGRRQTGPFFGVVTAEQDQPRDTKFGFVISRKIDKKATVRNRLKRLLCEAVGRLLPKIKSGYDVLFLAKRPLVRKDLGEIEKEVERMFRKVRLIK